jgi:hypothetical protein
VTPTDEERELVARQMPKPDPYVAALLRLLDAARAELAKANEVHRAKQEKAREAFLWAEELREKARNEEVAAMRGTRDFACSERDDARAALEASQAEVRVEREHYEQLRRELGETIAETAAERDAARAERDELRAVYTEAHEACAVGHGPSFEEVGTALVLALVKDIDDRRGFGREWRAIDVDIQAEIAAEWRAEVAHHLTPHRLYQHSLRTALDDVTRHRDAARAQVVELRRAGAMLANCAFNLKQRESLDADTRRSLAESQEAWDAAVRDALDAKPTAPTPAVDVTGSLRVAIVSGDLEGRVLVALDHTEGCTDCGETFTAEEQRAYDPENNDHCPRCGHFWTCTTWYGDPEYRVVEAELDASFAEVVPVPAVDAEEDAEEVALMRAVCEAALSWRPMSTQIEDFYVLDEATDKLRAYRERGR